MITDQHGNQIQSLTSSCMADLKISGNGLDKSYLKTSWQVFFNAPHYIAFISIKILFCFKAVGRGVYIAMPKAAYK